MKKMSWTKRNKRYERGQTLIIIMLGMTAFLAFLALTLDGGYAWSQRRKAQAAADAGALAGTRQLCISDSSSSATAAASDYAITRNGATTADITVDTNDYWVEVTAHVVFKTFFAHLLGRPEIDAQATARAACFTPSVGEGVLPIAWSCQPPLSGQSDSEDCELDWITIEQLDAYRPDFPTVAHNELYMIMDNASFDQDVICDDPNTVAVEGLNCDLDGDGVIDVLGQGSRSWLDLDGGGGGSDELRDWIEDGYPGKLTIHTWVPDQSGTANNVFQAAHNRIGHILAIPVFDMFCQGNITGTDCATLVHHNPPESVEDTIIPNSANSSIYVHISSFAGFVISCVESPGAGNPGERCPGWERLKLINGDPPGFSSTKTIEGYFITGFVPGLGGGEPGPPDAGVYVLLLTK
ncbi:MAG TPA: pilus assembly protein TadG-related protein [Anaerolineales bacterium]|nr:pilus assembly protein TadG-related protein [Anaerolineales bacterium]